MNDIERARIMRIRRREAKLILAESNPDAVAWWLSLSSYEKQCEIYEAYARGTIDARTHARIAASIVP